MADNGTSACGGSGAGTGIEGMAVYDRLPAPVRQALQAHNINVCAIHTRDFLRVMRQDMPARRAAALLARLIRQSEAQEMEVWAREHWGGQSPHTLAQATVLRP